MARIRSIHPGQWTDGNFVACSPFARLLCLAIRNQADDRGAFRWKPTDIKMKCLPGDNCDIEALLAEMVENEQIVVYEVGGKKYGLIKDFKQWQRPKSPTPVHPITEDLRKEFGIDVAKCDEISEITPTDRTKIPETPPISHTDSAPPPEIVPQRLDGGGKRKEEKGVPPPTPNPQPAPVDIEGRPPLRDGGGKISSRFLKWAIEGPLWTAAGASLDQVSPNLHQLADLVAWIEDGADFDHDILPAIKAKAAAVRPRMVKSWGFFAQAVANAKARRTATLPEPTDAWESNADRSAPRGIFTLEEIQAGAEQ